MKSPAEYLRAPVRYSIGSALLLAFFTGCNDPKKQAGDLAANPVVAETPGPVKKAILSEFPGAKPYSEAIDSLLNVLSQYGISPEEILWGQSTCVDDITSTKNKSVHPEIKGPFNIGGLGGMPFTGVTGISAFAHHVPEDGTALLFVGPHIGYNAELGWGKITRHGQHQPSACCGALVKALNNLKEGKTGAGMPSEDDYQEDVIGQLGLGHKKEILSAGEPLLVLTRIALSESKERMTRYVRKNAERHFPYAVVVLGVIINTDYQFEDYLWIEKIAIKDIKADAWIR